MTQFSPDEIRRAAQTPRWAALSQLGGVAADLTNYDRFLVREPRLLVPVDVQALVVRAGSNDTEPMLRLPFRDGDQTPPATDLADEGTPRPPGVHLLWSVPAALARGKLVDDPQAPGDATRRLLQLPLLPDRWAVLRLTVVAGSPLPLVTGWVIEADAGTITMLEDWPTVTTATVTVQPPIPHAQLTAHVGGTSWTQSYDAALGRFALHDSLVDLAGTEVEGDALTYLVAGWWSQVTEDPLNGVGTDIGYRQRLAELGWNDPDHPSPDASRRDEATRRYRTARTFGMATPQRYTQAASSGSGKAAATSVGSGLVAPAAKMLNPAISGFLHEAITAAALPPAPTRSTLLHGRLHGVPLNGKPTAESRPTKDAVRVVLGSNTPDLAASVAVFGTGLGTADQDARRAAERLLAAFSAGLIMRIGETDAWSDIAEYEHAHGFGSLPGGAEGVDRFVDKPGATADPGAGFRHGKLPRRKATRKAAVAPEATILWSAIERPAAAARRTSIELDRFVAADQFDGPTFAVPPTPPATVREVVRPAPRFHQPAAPVLAVAGGGRALSAVEREEADGALMCRLSDQTSRGHAGVLAATELLTTIGSAAVPDEILDLAREALAEDPYLSRWRTDRALPRGFDRTATMARFVAESAVAHSYYAADNDRLSGFLGTEVSSAATRQIATEGLLRLSLSEGVWSHPEGVTMWGQPWRPMFCDWEVTLDLGAGRGWGLDGVDLEPGTPAPAMPESLTLSGRSGLVTGVAGTLAAGIDKWLAEERQRDLGGHGLADPATENSLSALRDAMARLDLMSVALDGIRERLLGLDYEGGLIYRDTDALPDGTPRAVVLGLPRLLAAGRVTLTAARLVDAFGRSLALPVDDIMVPARLADESGRAMLARPRLTAPARWHFDLVDAISTTETAELACVDQADPAKQINPVAGFLLPDHLDESLEVFATDGRPLGELLHDSFSDAVTWEIAPGRIDVAPAAGPTDDPDVTHHRVGWIAAGLVAADAAARNGTPNRPETESALSAMLRAIDTTLWTVDPFGSLGSEHIAGLVGRPIAVVAARLSLDVYSDVAERAYHDETLRTGRTAAYDALAAVPFEVRLGEITRADDGLLGYFVDDDYAHFHLVDKVIASEALPSGRRQGVLDPDNADPTVPVAIEHPYIDDSGVLRIHPGQTVRLTLLMHPGGKVHLTSGILPRTDRALARDWVQPGLAVLAPSLRCGPLLIDADKVRLPKVASFPAEQLFTRRDSATTWKDDPILAATQSAMLPDTAPEVQEGWVRVAPNPPAPDGTDPSGTAG
jgi:hypothetical protein